MNKLRLLLDKKAKNKFKSLSNLIRKDDGSYEHRHTDYETRIDFMKYCKVVGNLKNELHGIVKVDTSNNFNDEISSNTRTYNHHLVPEGKVTKNTLNEKVDISPYPETDAVISPLDKLLNAEKIMVHDKFPDNIEDAVEFVRVPDTGIDYLSDGYHTFDSLYKQRLVLFATIVNTYPKLSWKSYKHEDGEKCFGGGWFIVGIDTEEGPYTYHFENKYFDLFRCKELDRAKHFDGHTDKDVTRLLRLVNPLYTNK